MDTQTQIDRLIELAIIQRTELKQLVEQLPQLREHLNAEVEKVFEETEPQLRAELEEWTTKQTADKTAALGVALEAKIADLAKSLEVSTQARYNAIIAEREENARLAAQAEAKIAEHAASLPSAVKEIVSAELARFPRAGEIDQLRKEFAEPRGLNPRGKWQAGETYNRLDLVTYNGDSFVSNIDGNTEKPSRNAANWTLNAARGAYGGGGGITSLNDVLNAPTSGQIIGSQNGQYVPKTLVAGANITINETANAITIIGDEGQISLNDGTAASPALFFTNDTDTGLYRPAANTLGVAVGGAQVAYFDANGITTVGAGATFDGSVHAANGNANNPSLSFTSDDNTGFFRHQPDEIGITLGGTQTGTLTSALATLTSKLLVSSGATTTAATDLLVNPAVKASGNLLDLQVASSSKFSVSSAGNGTFGGNLTVSGTGTSSFAGPLKLTYGTNLAATDIGLFATSGGGLFINAPTTKNIRLGFANSERLTLDESTATFATNLTVSGTGTHSFNGPVLITGTSASNLLRLTKSGAGSKTFGIDNALDFRIYADNGSTQLFKLTDSGDTTITGNLTVSGGTITGGTSGLSLASGGTNQNITLTPSGTGATVISKAETNTNAITTALNYIKIQNTSSGGTYIGALEFYTWDNRRAAGIFANRNNVDGTSGILSFAYSTSVNSFTEGFRLNSTGNVLLGTTTDSGNGKLQLATHTTSAGGIGFGTDTSLYRTAAGFLQVDSLSGNNPAIKLAQAGVAKVWMEYYAPDLRGYITTADSLAIRTNGGTTALTLDSSQNATFAGNYVYVGGGTSFYLRATGSGNGLWYGNTLSVDIAGSFSLRNQAGSVTNASIDSSGNATFAGTIKPQQAATASAPTYVKGAIYFDTTLNKLRVGGATGWETITSV